MSNPKQKNYLSVSTAHCPHSAFEEDCKEYVLGSSAEDVFIYVPEKRDVPAETPTWLYYIFMLAIYHNCYLIRFDPGGDDHDELQKFNW